MPAVELNPRHPLRFSQLCCTVLGRSRWLTHFLSIGRRQGVFLDTRCVHPRIHLYFSCTQHPCSQTILHTMNHLTTIAGAAYFIFSYDTANLSSRSIACHSRSGNATKSVTLVPMESIFLPSQINLSFVQLSCILDAISCTQRTLPSNRCQQRCVVFLARRYSGSIGCEGAFH